jgi:hypothetical protein
MIRLMKSVVEEKLSELVFNLDEVGSPDLEDRKPKKVIVPRSVSPDDTYKVVFKYLPPPLPHFWRQPDAIKHQGNYR